MLVAVSFLMLHGGLSVFYADALYEKDRHLHKWLRKAENKFKNDVICWFCHMGYGLGYYIIIVRQWMLSV